MIRAVLYLRSSKDRADASPAAQRRALEELARARQIIIVGEFVDAVESGKDDDRPGFQSLLRAIRAPDRNWDHILVLDTARIARRRALAIIFEEQECKRRGIRIFYKSLPDSDPITEMLLKSILQAMDEWHSLTSKVKGLAGMAENVRQGWRAGGRAPRGYVLHHVETGAIRDGVPVSKSKLVPSEESSRVRTFMQNRARGIKRARALEIAGADWASSTVIEMERNALVYAGHTVWNKTAERIDGGYVNGLKWRPRSEWVIQRDTHEALITDDEAETILAALEVKKRGGGRPARRTYLLAGLMFTPEGESWSGDGGNYRLGKGTRISADPLEKAVVAQLVADLQSDATATAIAEHYRKQAKAMGGPDEAAALRRRVAEIDRKTARLADLAADAKAPDALIRQIEGLEAERARISETLENFDADTETAKVLREVTPGEIKRMLKEVANDMAECDPEPLRDTLRQVVDKIEISPDSFEATMTYRFAPASKSGVWLASPRGFEPRFTP